MRRREFIGAIAGVGAVGGAIGSGMTPISQLDYCRRATRYAQRIVAGKIPAGELVQLACERHLRDLKQKNFPWKFRPEFGNRICSFIERMPHVQGRWDTENIVVEDWQCFHLTSIFGWVDPDGYRRYKRAYLEVARKNAKTTESAGVGLFLFAVDEEPGAEVYTAAVTRDQARHTWLYAQQMAKKRPAFRNRYGVRVLQHHLEIEPNGSVFRPLHRDSDALEGLNVHGAVIDELHAHKTREVFDVIDSATGSRRQPLIVIITTAGEDYTNVGGEQHDYVADILRGYHEDDNYFGCIYGIDKGDDWTSDEVIPKANPNMDVSVFFADIDAQRRKALKNPRAQSEYQRKRLCVWGGAADAYFNLLAWQQLCRADIKLEDMEGRPCYFGLDLATKDDLASLAMLFRLDKSFRPAKCETPGDPFALFCRHYIPETTVDDRGNPNYERYQGWRDRENFIITPGDLIDYDVIEDDLFQFGRRFRPTEIGYDPWNTSGLGPRMSKRGLPMVEVPMTTRQLSEPMKLIERRIVAGLLLHDGDQTLSWAIGNVTAKEDANENVFPRKSKPEKKIDPAVAGIIGYSRAVVTPARKRPRCLDHGPLILEL